MTAASCPIGKVSYPSPQAVYRVIKQLQRRASRPRTGRRRHSAGGTAYRCPDCGCWHLTSAARRR